MNDSNLEILAYEPSPLGPLCLRRRRLLSDPDTVITEITLNHEFLMSSRDTRSERQLTLRALKLHGGDRLSVLVGGLGLGYTAKEALRSERVRRVEVVELLPPVIRWLEEGLVPLAGELRGDPRFSVSPGDIYGQLLEPPNRRFDLVLIDVDHSPEEQLGAAPSRFYGADGLERARRHLNPGGILGVWSYAENAAFCDLLRATFGEVRVEAVHIPADGEIAPRADWIFLARV